ncbi:HAMP domain-containing protein [Parabacteroides distasonis]|nr:HAMP domain-containing protein [Parabacteroides distasonis]
MKIISNMNLKFKERTKNITNIRSKCKGFKKNSNLSIQKKISRALNRISILGIISLAICIVLLLITNIQYKKALTNYGLSQGIIGEIGIKFNTQRADLREMVLISDVRSKEVKKKNIELALAANDELILKLKDTCIDEESKKIFNIISQNIETYKETTNTIINYSLAGNEEDAIYYITTKGKQNNDLILYGIDSLLDFNINKSNQIMKFLNILESSCIGITILFIISLIMVSKRSSKNISTDIIVPIDTLKGFAEELASGNLDVTIQLNSKDEIGQLANSFQHMSMNLKSYIYEISNILTNISQGNLVVDINADYKGDFIKIKDSLSNIIFSLNETFKEIKEATYQVKVSSEQLDETAQSLSEGASSQAHAIDSLTSSIGEINSKISDTAEHATNTNSIVNNLVTDIESTKDEMDKMLKAMHEIEASSKNIETIVSAIDSIAAETNLLALNAAIEAAIAGEA